MRLRRGIASLDPFQRQLARLLDADVFIEGLPLDRPQARAAFIKDGACWLWAEHRDHVRGLPAEAQLALIDDAYASDKRVASDMLAVLFPGDAGGSVVGL